MGIVVSEFLHLTIPISFNKWIAVNFNPFPILDLVAFVFITFKHIALWIRRILHHAFREAIRKDFFLYRKGYNNGLQPIAT